MYLRLLSLLATCTAVVNREEGEVPTCACCPCWPPVQRWRIERRERYLRLLPRLAGALFGLLLTGIIVTSPVVRSSTSFLRVRKRKFAMRQPCASRRKTHTEKSEGCQQSWERHNTAATRCPCFQATELLVITLSGTIVYWL